MLPIALRGARTHNLKGLDLDLRPGELVALVGPSGAGKSSLALDTLYAEGQRRFVESFSPYARQFLERLPRPPIDKLAPVAAGVAVERRTHVKSSRSTLATLADLEPYLAALFAKEAVPRCPTCGLDAQLQTAEQTAARWLEAHRDLRAIITFRRRWSPLDPAAGWLDTRAALMAQGYHRAWFDGAPRELEQLRPSELEGCQLDVVVDRLVLRARDAGRLRAALDAAWSHGDGEARLHAQGEAAELALARRGLSCPGCAQSFTPPQPGLFSYNSPLGACSACRGFGRTMDIDWDKVLPDHELSLSKGAIRPWSGKSSQWERSALKSFAQREGVRLDVPWRALSERERTLVIEGEPAAEGDGSRVLDGQFPGVRAWFKWLESKAYKMHVRVLLARYRAYVPCQLCGGGRLNERARAYRVGGRNLPEWHALSVREARGQLEALRSHDPQGARAQSELLSRLQTLQSVGVEYLHLDRQARTLSGGELQRATLAGALGSQLTQALFVLDEPSIGLHPSDVPALAEAVRALADAGNCVVMIEHHQELIARADRVLALGPGAGPHGGAWVTDPPPTPPLQLASRRRKTEEPAELELRHVRLHNVAIERLRVPLRQMVAVVGPSGSGKSTLVQRTLFPLLARTLGDTSARPLAPSEGELTGWPLDAKGKPLLREVSLVDQAPLGRTARGNAATYTKAWNRLRERFADEPAARHEGLAASHFSFNVAGEGAGRCEACAGEGFETVEMQFLADVHLPCPVCRGSRFRPEVLRVRHRGKNVAEVLAMSVAEVLAHFADGSDPDYVLKRALEPLLELGLGYLPLGQPLSTLSGGEAQRLKLARGLATAKPDSLFVLDEPTAGLAPSDSAQVLTALRALTARGASVLVVAHDLALVAQADHVLELGPGAGDDGGRLVFEGSPAQLARAKSLTGRALAARLAAQPSPASPAPRPLAGRSAVGIEIHGAREHSLKNVSCTFPSEALTVVTGPSGSGKSSLAFDVLYAEGQRRFLDTLSPYARQFLPTLPRPQVDAVLHVPPSIALEQRESRGGSSSTVSTLIEAAQYLRLLYAKLGEPQCVACGGRVVRSSREQVREALRAHGAKKITLYARAVHRRKGTYAQVFVHAARRGLSGARVDGEIVAIDPPPALKRTAEHTVDLIVHFGPAASIDDATLDRALELGHGSLRIGRGEPARDDAGEQLLSLHRACHQCGEGVDELEPGQFSFSTPQGRCERCEGSGHSASGRPCKTCDGSRLGARGRSTTLCGLTLPALHRMELSEALATIAAWRFDDDARAIGEVPRTELLKRLQFAEQIGLGYLALERPADTLSGGELQRLALSAQLGSGLTGALYVLDEPTIGLHPADTGRLLGSLRELARTGSTVVVVEHDLQLIQSADHLIDMGPGGGREGGHIIAAGTAAEVLASDSATARAVRAARQSPRPARPPESWLGLSGARGHNLQDVTLRLPKQRLTVLAGPSGSGKSTLAQRILLPAVRRSLGLESDAPLGYGKLTHLDGIERALSVDQAPIGRTPRSVPATFIGIWDDIRKLFAKLPEAQVRGFGPTHFSFNSKQGGRCPACEGQGYIVSEMSFLPDVVQPCESCATQRFGPDTLEVRYQGLHIGEVLQLSAREALSVFAAHRKLVRPLQALDDLGVGYLQLGQPSNTLSGGEAQRLKLAAELTVAMNPKPTLYVLDEPTTGLHADDVTRLLAVLDKLLARGDTLLLVEHNEQVLRAADWVIELGPGGGRLGGQITFEGTPAELAQADTVTGRTLR